MNKVLLIGRLASKAFEGKTTSNVNYARFTLAVPRQYQTPAGQEPIVDFIPCVAWRYNADFVNKYLDKGSLVQVEGSFQSNRITGKDGLPTKTYSINVERIEALESKAVVESRKRNSQEFNIPEASQIQNNSSQPAEDITPSDSIGDELDW